MGVAARIDAARANIAVDFFITLFKTVPPLSVLIQRETERIPSQEREEGLIKRSKGPLLGRGVASICLHDVRTSRRAFVFWSNKAPRIECGIATPIGLEVVFSV